MNLVQETRFIGITDHDKKNGGLAPPCLKMIYTCTLHCQVLDSKNVSWMIEITDPDHTATYVLYGAIVVTKIWAPRLRDSIRHVLVHGHLVIWEHRHSLAEILPLSDADSHRRANHDPN